MSKEQKECKDFKDNIDGLTNRLNINNGYGNNDLQSWVMEQLKVKDSEDVLDIGCGDGRHLKEISSLTSGQCVGIDYDEKMIGKSKANVADNLSYHHFSMDEINTPSAPIGGDKFNVIYSLYAFYYSKNSINLLELLKKRLKENGRVAIVGPYGNNNKDWFKFLNQYVELDESIMKSSYSFMDDIKSYANAIMAEKNYLEAYTHFGKDHPMTTKQKVILDQSIQNFEQKTGITWPFVDEE